MQCQDMRPVVDKEPEIVLSAADSAFPLETGRCREGGTLCFQFISSYFESKDGREAADVFRWRGWRGAEVSLSRGKNADINDSCL